MSKKNDYIDEYKKARRGIAIPGKTKEEVLKNFYSQARKDVYWGMKQRYIDDRVLGE